MLIYATAIALSIPGGAILTMTGGFLFGVAAATLYAVIAATLGATVVFLIAKTALGDTLREKAGPAMRRMEAGFRENALNYLLFLRLIPVFPFWLVNLVSAFLGVPLRTYVVATAVGIIPGTLVYASVGNGLARCSRLAVGQTSASSSSPRLSSRSLGSRYWPFSRLRTGKSKVVSQVDSTRIPLQATYVQGQCRGSSVGSLRSSRKKALGQVCRNGRSPGRPKAALFAAALVIGLATTALTFGFDLGIALDLLRAHHNRLLSFVAGAPALASIAFIMLYAAAVAISLPGVAILTVIGVICSAGGTARSWCWSPPRQVQAACSC